jgi:FG-GAP-like repeat/FG-GAP repeat
VLERPTPERSLEVGILSRPVLANLDGRPGLEVLVSALDGRVYAWGQGGARLAGFPVGLDAGPGSAGLAKIVSSPAVGDLDGDGEPEIVVGSNGLANGAARAYALRSRGRADPAGPLRPGWGALTLPAVRPGLLPTVATGVQMDPLLIDADGDGDLEVLLYAVTGSSIVLVDDEGSGPAIVARYSLEPAERSAFRDTYFLGGTGSPAAADLDGDGRPEIFAPLLPFRMLTLRAKPGVPLDVPLALGGWPASAARGSNVAASLSRRTSAETVPMIPGWPRRMEDLMLFARPLAADVDGDGKDEVLMGSGGYLLHAFRGDGGDAAGFPKFTGGWTFSAPATGDLDGDGIPEIVSVTREGYVFAWRSRAASRPVARQRPPG